MRLFKLVTLMITVAVTLMGCASLSGKFSPVKNFNKSKALIYVYRVAKFAGSAGSPYLCIDGKVSGEVVDGGYFAVQLNPGEHKVSTKSLGSETDSFSFNVIAGKTYYLRSDFSSLKRGTGAGLVGDAIWASSSDEKKEIINNLDKSAQKQTEDASLLFVKETFAEKEIAKTKEFKVPKYEKNHCKKIVRKVKK